MVYFDTFNIRKIYLFLAMLALGMTLLLGSSGRGAAVPLPDPLLPQAPLVQPSPAPVIESTTSSQPDSQTNSQPDSQPNSQTDSQTDRLSAPLSEALLGHWTTNSGETHSYFAQDKVIVVNLLSGQEQQTNSYKQSMTYEISLIDEATSLMHLKVLTHSGWAQERMLRFASDRQTFMESMEIWGHPFSSNWTYIDEQQQP